MRRLGQHTPGGLYGRIACPDEYVDRNGDGDAHRVANGQSDVDGYRNRLAQPDTDADPNSGLDADVDRDAIGQGCEWRRALLQQ